MEFNNINMPSINELMKVNEKEENDFFYGSRKEFKTYFNSSYGMFNLTMSELHGKIIYLHKKRINIELKNNFNIELDTKNKTMDELIEEVKSNYNNEKVKKIIKIIKKVYPEPYKLLCFNVIKTSDGYCYFTPEKKLFDKNNIDLILKNKGYLGLYTKYFNEVGFQIFNLVYKLQDNNIKDNEINLMNNFLYRNPRQTKEFNIDTKEKAEQFFKYIKIAYCSYIDENHYREDIFEFIIKWLSQTVRGKKSGVAIVLKGREGTGKSIFAQFIMDYVIGENLTKTIGNTQDIMRGFDIELMGNVLIHFEEIISSENNWKIQSSLLKRYIDSRNIDYGTKGKNKTTYEDFCNYILSSNIKIADDQGRRYLNLDINPALLENNDFFRKLKDNIFNEEVGEYIFSYLLEYNNKEHLQSIVPMTEQKIRSYIKSYPSPIKFIRDEYLFKNKPLIIKLTDLYRHYRNYCLDNGIKKIINKDEFPEILAEWGIECKNYHNIHKYNINKENFNNLALKQKFNHKTKYFENEIEPITDKNDDGLDYKILKDNIIIDLKKENEELKLKVQELENKFKLDYIKENFEKNIKILEDLSKTKKIKHDKTKPKTHKIITEEGEEIKYKIMNKIEFQNILLENLL